MRNDDVRVALVTGANRGLGFETARQLLAKGLVVVLAGRDTDALERARGTLGADEQRRAVPVQLDVTNLETISAYKEMLQRASASDMDLIEMGARGSGGIELMLYGSNTHHGVRAATCPVRTVRA
jgi:NADP-dependent 3-hydroxy acid dehydrogenase YdfG